MLLSKVAKMVSGWEIKCLGLQRGVLKEKKMVKGSLENRT